MMEVFTVHEYANGSNNMIGVFESLTSVYQLLFMRGVTLSKCVTDVDRNRPARWIFHGYEHASYKIERQRVYG